MRQVTQDKLSYSEAFKQKVVEEVLRGKYSIEECRKVYDIRGGSTIQNWLVALGHQDKLGRRIRIEMKDERDKLKAQEKQLKEYERIIAKQQVKLDYYDALLTIGKQKYGIDLKKKSGPEESE